MDYLGSLFLGLVIGGVAAIWITESTTRSNLRKNGVSLIGSRWRIVGHIEQKIDGFKNKWEKVGGEE